MFARQHGHCVERNRIGPHLFMFGQRRCVPISRRRSRVHHTLDLGITRRYQHVHRPIDVGAVAAQRIEHGFRYRRNRRLMQDVINSGASLTHRLQIGDIRLAKVDAISDFSDVVQLASGKVVDAAHPLATRKQLPRNRRSDEASDACDEVLSHDKHHTKVSGLKLFKVSKASCREAMLIPHRPTAPKYGSRSSSWNGSLGSFEWFTEVVEVYGFTEMAGGSPGLQRCG